MEGSSPEFGGSPPFQGAWKEKEDADGATGKIYSFTDAEKTGGRISLSNRKRRKCQAEVRHG